MCVKCGCGLANNDLYTISELQVRQWALARIRFAALPVGLRLDSVQGD